MTVRKRRGFTQETLSRGICDRSYLSMLEHDKVVPPVDLLSQLLTRLDLAWSDIEHVFPTQAKPSRRTPSVMSTCRELYRHGDAAMAFRLASNFWWEATEEPQLARHIKDVTLFLLVVARDIPDNPLVGSWLVGAWQYAIAHNRNDAGSVGVLLQQWLFDQRRWHESWAIGRTLRRDFSGTNIALIATIGVGSAYCELGHGEEATVYYETALSEWESSAKIELLGSIHHGLSASYAQLEQWNEAGINAQRAHDFYYSVGSNHAYEALHNLAIIRAYQQPTGVPASLDILEKVAKHYEVTGRHRQFRVVLEDCLAVAKNAVGIHRPDWRVYQTRLDNL